MACAVLQIGGAFKIGLFLVIRFFGVLLAVHQIFIAACITGATAGTFHNGTGGKLLRRTSP